MQNVNKCEIMLKILQLTQKSVLFTDCKSIFIRILLCQFSSTVLPLICSHLYLRISCKIYANTLSENNARRLIPGSYWLVLTVHSPTPAGRKMSHCSFCALWPWFALPSYPCSPATTHKQVRHFRPDMYSFFRGEGVATYMQSNLHASTHGI